MASYPWSIFLSVGDGLTVSGSDVVPASGEYIDLFQNHAYRVVSGGFSAPPYQESSAERKAGAVMRIKSVRALPLRTITLDLEILSNNTDAGSVWANWRKIEHMLERARAASGPLGIGTNVCLLVRQTTAQSSSLEQGFTFFDVLDGRLIDKPPDAFSGLLYPATLQLDCLPYGRMKASTYPSPSTYTATRANDDTGSVLYLGTSPATSGPIPGHVGALAQIHILDVSTAGAINRARIGRRSAGSDSAASGDWTGVINSSTALGGASVVTLDANAIGGDRVEQAVSDGDWHNLARFSSANPTTPLLEPGYYDVFCRVKETAPVIAPVSIESVSTSALAAGSVLVPDQYTVRVRANDGTSTSDVGAGTIATVSYANGDDFVFADGFETGDTAAWLTEQAGSHGDLGVTTQYAVAGQYGLRARLSTLFPNISGSTYSYPPADAQRVIKPLYLTGDATVTISFWVKLLSASSVGVTTLGGISSQSCALANPPYSIISGNQTPTNSGFIEGYLAALGFSAVNGFSLLTPNGTGTPTSTALSGLTPAIGTLYWVHLTTTGLGVSSAAPAATLTMYDDQGNSYTASHTGATPGSAPAVADQVIVGPAVFGTNGASAIDLIYDDVFVATTALGPAPTNGLLVTTSDAGSNHDLFVEGSNGNTWEVPRVANSHVLSNFDLNSNPLSEPPFPAIPQPAQFRALLSVPGSLALPIYSSPTPTDLQGGKWHALYLGTLPLPPLAQMEGLNPAHGTGSGAFPWQMDIQGLSGYGSNSNTLSVDALWLFPHSEPQLLAYFSGLANTTPTEIVMDTRRDGRTGAFARDAATQTTTLGALVSQGSMQLAPGNQHLIVLLEREGGVHDVQHTAFQAQVRYQPLTQFLNDDPNTY